MMMLLPMPHDIPEVTFPEVRETRDEDTPVVISRRLTPANRPLQLLEAGRLGASATEHLPSRPAVPDLCIASSSLLSALDPLPLDSLSRHDDSLTLMSAGLIPRLEGGIRAVLDETANL